MLLNKRFANQISHIKEKNYGSKKGETGTYVKWLQQGLHITMIIGCSSLFNFIVTNIIYYRFLSVASSPESAQEIFLFPHVSYALYQ